MSWLWEYITLEISFFVQYFGCWEVYQVQKCEDGKFGEENQDFKNWEEYQVERIFISL